MAEILRASSSDALKNDGGAGMEIPAFAEASARQAGHGGQFFPCRAASAARAYT
ncbi:MAG TPA: hypothetical protein VN661_01850 [Candidatus Acidoferrales bacterium]|nr:hypothetical protein [Candidatus Acidoferrales bacterium]